MKPTIFLILAIFFQSTVFSQNAPFATTKSVKVKGKIYSVTEVSNTRRVIVKRDIANHSKIKFRKYTEHEMALRINNIPMIKPEWTLLYKTFIKSLGKEKIASLEENQWVNINMTHDNHGKIIEISFDLDAKTTITPEEIERFENELIAHYKPKIGKPRYLTDFPYFNTSPGILVSVIKKSPEFRSK
jgi:hypothetical protein